LNKSTTLLEVDMIGIEVIIAAATAAAANAAPEAFPNDSKWLEPEAKESEGITFGDVVLWGILFSAIS
jgi:hypothetical protein